MKPCTKRRLKTIDHLGQYGQQSNRVIALSKDAISKKISILSPDTSGRVVITKTHEPIQRPVLYEAFDNEYTTIDT